MSWLTLAMKKYAELKGRARRKEFWMFSFFVFLIAFSVAGGCIATGMSVKRTNLFVGLSMLPFVIPAIAVSIRRLHDTGKSGWWFLISLVPIIGPIGFFIFTVQDSQPGENQYGPQYGPGPVGTG